MSTIGACTANWVMEIPYMLVQCALIIVTSKIACTMVIDHSKEIVPQNLR